MHSGDSSGDLPRTMARIRRLVRDHPNDRELQRLLHTLLTGMSSERIDVKQIVGALTNLERRKQAQPGADPNSPPLTLAVAQLVTSAGNNADSSSPDPSASCVCSALMPLGPVSTGDTQAQYNQLRRRSEQQLVAAAESMRTEQCCSKELGTQLSELQVRLVRLEASPSSEQEAKCATLECNMSAELSSMAAAHRVEIEALTLAASANLEREMATRERALARLEARFQEERVELERHANRTEVRGVLALVHPLISLPAARKPWTDPWVYFINLHLLTPHPVLTLPSPLKPITSRPFSHCPLPPSHEPIDRRCVHSNLSCSSSKRSNPFACARKSQRHPSAPSVRSVGPPKASMRKIVASGKRR